MNNRTDSAHTDGEADDFDLAKYLAALLPRWRLIGASMLVAGAIGAGASYLITPTFTARSTFLSPQQQNSSGAAMAQLGALANLAGGGSVGIKSPADQYVSLMLSDTISRRIIERFDLMQVYGTKLVVNALEGLALRVRVTAGKKDNLITVEVDDQSPQRAADIANAYVEELQLLTSKLALTDSQQRRLFFEQQFRQTRDNLTEAQVALQKSGFNADAIKIEPKAAADSYAALKAQIIAAEVRLESMRRMMKDGAPEIQTQMGTLSALRGQLAAIEAPNSKGSKQDYIGAHREYQYQLALFQIMSRQFEQAKLDEARDGTVYQIIDVAKAPERKSKPRRSMIAIGAALAGLFGSCAWVLLTRRRSA